MWKIKIQKNCWQEQKFKILSLMLITQKVSTSTRIFWLKHISTPHYKHLTIYGHAIY